MEKFDFVCISLQNRQDRRDEGQETYRRLGILKQMNWWIVQKHPQGGMYGCFESHVSVWNSSEYKRPFLCVFEDDVRLASSDGPQRFAQILQDAQTYLPDYAEIINLEPGLGYVESVIKPGLCSGSFLRLGCYIIHRSVIPKLTRTVRDLIGIDLDIAMYKSCRMLATIPKFLDQDEQDSDNGGGYRSLGSVKGGRLVKTLRDMSPLTSYFGLEASYLLSRWYLQFRPDQIEFKDRRVHIENLLFTK